MFIEGRWYLQRLYLLMLKLDGKILSVTKNQNNYEVRISYTFWYNVHNSLMNVRTEDIVILRGNE